MLLEIKDLHVSFPLDEGTVRAVEGVDLTMRRGASIQDKFFFIPLAHRMPMEAGSSTSRVLIPRVLRFGIFGVKTSP